MDIVFEHAVGVTVAPLSFTRGGYGMGIAAIHEHAAVEAHALRHTIYFIQVGLKFVPLLSVHAAEVGVVVKWCALARLAGEVVRHLKVPWGGSRV